jgi:hypothetical protein
MAKNKARDTFDGLAFLTTLAVATAGAAWLVSRGVALLARDLGLAVARPSFYAVWTALAALVAVGAILRIAAFGLRSPRDVDAAEEMRALKLEATRLSVETLKVDLAVAREQAARSGVNL